MTDFTKGPWEAFKGIEKGDQERCGVSAMRGKVGYLLATIENGAPGDFCDTEFANARLIAAAPDLLEALQNLLSRCWGENEPEIVAARVVIAKALGEETA